MNSLTTVWRWYEGRIPPLRTAAFYRFIANAGQFIGYVTHDPQPTRVLFGDVPTAAVDIEHRKIRLPYWALTPELYHTLDSSIPRLPEEDYPAAATGVVTGLLVHEGLHLLLSKSDPMKIILNHRRYPEFQRMGYPQRKALLSLNNILEDLFIEHYGLSKPYGLFLEVLHDLMFSEAYRDTCQRDFAEEPNAIHILRLLNAYRNPRLRDSLDLPDETRQVLEKALTTSDRVECAFTLYDIYRELFEQATRDDSRQFPSGTSERWDAPNEPDTNDRGEEVNAKLRCTVCQTVDRSLNEAGLRKYELDDALTNSTMYRRQEPDHYDDRIPPVQEKDILDAGVRAPDAVQAAPEFRNLGHLFKLLRSKNITYGPPMDHGRRIVSTRLARLATDQKIFGLPVERTQKDEREVILCGDISGSMNLLLRPLISAMKGAYLSLRECNIRCMAYVHTTDWDTTNWTNQYKVPRLWFVADNTSTYVEDRFSLPLVVPHCETYDGAVIQYLGRKFSPRNSTKVLIMLCDGEPNCGWYTGQEAQVHTRRAVQDLRRQGIIVLVLSLNDDVMESNDFIYGKAFNINASHAIDAALRRVLEPLIKA